VTNRQRLHRILEYRSHKTYAGFCWQKCHEALRKNRRVSLRQTYGCLTFNFVRIKTTDAAKLQDEYAKLVEGLQEATPEQNDTDGFMGNPCRSNSVLGLQLAKRHMLVLPDDLLNEAIPGNIRKAEHFVAFLKRFVEYLKVRLDNRYNKSH